MIYEELEFYFPDLFTNVLSQSFWRKLKEKTIKQLESILEDKDIEEEMTAADRYFASLMQLKSFSGKESEEIRYDKNFEQNCIALAGLVNEPVKDMTVKEYFSLIQYHNKKKK